MRIGSILLRTFGTMACAVGKHLPMAYRSLTCHSCEFRCLRCERRWADVHEPWIPIYMRGAYPYEDANDSLGERLAWRGANLSEDRADQTPMINWQDKRQRYLRSTGHANTDQRFSVSSSF